MLFHSAYSTSFGESSWIHVLPRDGPYKYISSGTSGRTYQQHAFSDEWHPGDWSDLRIYKKVSLQPQGYNRGPSWVCFLISKILRHMYDDGMDKLRKVRDRCYECIVVLKFSKATFGFTHVKIFGYKVQDGKWCLDDDRKQAVTDTLMATDLKKMQRCLGVGIFLVSLYRTMQPRQPNYMTWLNQRSTET